MEMALLPIPDFHGIALHLGDMKNTLESILVSYSGGVRLLVRLKFHGCTF